MNNLLSTYAWDIVGDCSTFEEFSTCISDIADGEDVLEDCYEIWADYQSRHQECIDCDRD